MSKNLLDLFEEKKMSIIVSLPENRIDLAKAALEAGADALKCHINVNHRASGNTFLGLDHYMDTFKHIRNLYEGPFGIVLYDDMNLKPKVNLDLVGDAGFNYFSLYAKDVGSILLHQNKLQKTVAVDDKFTPAKASVIEKLGMEAVELSIVEKVNYGTPLNFEDMTLYQAYRDNTNLPIIIPSQKRLIPEDVAVLHSIGVQSIMLGAMTLGTTEKSIYESVSQFTNSLNKIN